MENQPKVGDWVRILDGLYRGLIGRITLVHPIHPKNYRFRLVVPGKAMPFYYAHNVEELDPMLQEILKANCNS